MFLNDFEKKNSIPQIFHFLRLKDGNARNFFIKNIYIDHRSHEQDLQISSA